MNFRLHPIHSSNTWFCCNALLGKDGNEQNEPSTIPEDAEGEVQRGEGADEDDQVGDQVPLSPRSKRDDAESEDMPTSNASDVSVSEEEEEPLDAELAKADAHAAEAFLPGVYVTRSRCKVLRSADVVHPLPGDIIKEFKAGTFCNVMSFKLLPERRLLPGPQRAEQLGRISLISLSHNSENLLDLPQASSQVEYHPRRHDGTDDPKDFAPLHERKEDGPGLYVLTRTAVNGRAKDSEMVCVSPSCWNVDPDDEEIVEELDEGTLVKVEEVKNLYQEGRDLDSRIRARLEAPDGWITLLNTENGRRWAMKADEVQNQLPEAVEEGSDDEEEESETPVSQSSSPEELLEEVGESSRGESDDPGVASPRNIPE
eukprot:s599_g22.t1